ncbi:MAG TPA: hypothetical protein VHE60_07350 [Pyrinomonadaceae bacterium]|nr:hypothetical protein [Pyrinomonadaceae bacterium]
MKNLGTTDEGGAEKADNLSTVSNYRQVGKNMATETKAVMPHSSPNGGFEF